MNIQHNISALNTKNRLSATDKKLEKALKRLSSGFQINSAADDAAGLAISEKMRALITSAAQAQSNIQDGISLVQVADGAMEEIHQMLNRSVELSMQSANGVYTQEERNSLQAELDSLKKEIDRVTQGTEFNGISILQGSNRLVTNTLVKISGTLPVWVTPDASMAAGFMSDSFQTLETYETVVNGVTVPQTFPIDHVAAKFDFSSFTGTPAQIEELKKGGFYFTCCTCSSHYSIEFTDGTGTGVKQSGTHNVYTLGIDNISNGKDLVAAMVAAMDNGNPAGHYTKLTPDPAFPESLVIYDDRSKDPPPPAATGGQWKNWQNPEFSVKANAQYGLVGQGVATAKTVVSGDPDMVLMIGVNNSDILWLDLPNTVPGELGIDHLSILTENDAHVAMDTLKGAINYISEERGRMGSYQNRLEHTYNNMQNYEENMTRAESVIRDADMAMEYSKLTKEQIISQSATAMLSQANQQPQRILQLLS